MLARGMYIASWEEFSSRAKALFLAAPGKARYCIRYNHTGSKLVIKVTDDTKVCSYLFLAYASAVLLSFAQAATAPVRHFSCHMVARSPSTHAKLAHACTRAGGKHARGMHTTHGQQLPLANRMRTPLPSRAANRAGAAVQNRSRKRCKAH